ncbi:hypothetical protein HHI36_019460 [Cryptolaemus montrouzieri]|uniref:Uncharacterized protein n=1 Tax=Cryptolaemus montrouzieri TaxID=559131 RepID=A0ABD2P352_9CUCU
MMYKCCVWSKNKFFPLKLCHCNDAKTKRKRAPELVWAEWIDETFQPASIVGKSRFRSNLVEVFFYHNGRHKDISPVNIIYNHGNLLDARVTVKYNGSCIVAKVYGNNSPKFKGFPTVFYVRLERTRSFIHVPLRRVFLTKDQAKILLVQRKKS